MYVLKRLDVNVIAKLFNYISIELNNNWGFQLKIPRNKNLKMGVFWRKMLRYSINYNKLNERFNITIDNWKIDCWRMICWIKFYFDKKTKWTFKREFYSHKRSFQRFRSFFDFELFGRHWIQGWKILKNSKKQSILRKSKFNLKEFKPI